MTPSPLTAAQQGRVDALVNAKRLQQVPADLQRCQEFVRQAGEALADLTHVTRDQNRYNLAYDAAHDIGEAALATYGYRAVHGPGQHDTLGRFLAAVFDQPPENQAAQHYDQMRRERNQQRYNARPVTAAAAAAAAAQAARLLVTAARRQLS